VLKFYIGYIKNTRYEVFSADSYRKAKPENSGYDELFALSYNNEAYAEAQARSLNDRLRVGGR